MLTANARCVQTTRLYDVHRNTLCGRHVQEAPVLDACFDGDSAAFSVGLEGKVKRWGPHGWPANMHTHRTHKHRLPSFQLRMAESHAPFLPALP